LKIFTLLSQEKIGLCDPGINEQMEILKHFNRLFLKKFQKSQRIRGDAEVPYKKISGLAFQVTL